MHHFCLNIERKHKLIDSEGVKCLVPKLLAITRIAVLEDQNEHKVRPLFSSLDDISSMLLSQFVSRLSWLLQKAKLGTFGLRH